METKMVCQLAELDMLNPKKCKEVRCGDGCGWYVANKKMEAIKKGVEEHAKYWPSKH